MLRTGKLTVLMVGLLLGCGGSQSPASGKPMGDGSGASEMDALDVPPALANRDEVENEAEAEAAPAEKPAVTFRLVNKAKDELVFSIEKGWQPVIFAFSGKPPKAKSIILFPKSCTAACDLGAEARCPHCPEPERARNAPVSEGREVVAPGASIEVPWDGQIHVYEKTRGTQDGKAARCECYRKEPVPPETYTVRACGLRITKSASSTTKYQCVDGTMTFPSDGPEVVTLEFPAP